MKLAILLPGYLDSPEYLHFRVFAERLSQLAYTVLPLDLCRLWESNDVANYSVTNTLKQIQDTINSYPPEEIEEIILIGHSFGAFVSIIAASRLDSISKVIALCPPVKASKSKWPEKGLRHSERDLPNDSQKFRSFSIPYSFAEDMESYSVLDEVKNIDKPLMVFIALEDQSVDPADSEKIVESANNPYVVRQAGIGHSFRQSEQESQLVMSKIEEFLQET